MRIRENLICIWGIASYFYQDGKAKSGVLGLWASAETAILERELRDTFQRIWSESETFVQRNDI